MKALDYTFSVDGSFSELNYYRQLSEIDVNNLPAPTLTTISARALRDESAALDTKYFVRFGAKAGNTEKLSDEVYAYQASDFAGSPYLISQIKSTAIDWSTSASDYSAQITADASWQADDYIVVCFHSRSATITSANGLVLLYSRQNTLIANSYVHVFGGFKGAVSAFSFTLATAVGGSCFAASAVALSNVESFIDAVYSEQSGSYFVENVRNGASDGLIAVSTIAYDANATFAFNPSVASPPHRYTYSNVSGIRGSCIVINHVLDFLNKSKTNHFSTNTAINAVNATLFFRRKTGVRPSLTYNKSYLQSQIEASKGYAYAVLKNGEIAETVVGGIEKTSGNAITQDTVFQIASISKLITELAIRKLAEDSALSLDDTLDQYFADVALGANVSSIKIRDLLAMKSGMSSYYDVLSADYLQSTKAWLTNSAVNVGKQYSYNNGCFAVLHVIIDRLTGSYVDYVQNNIFKKICIYDATHDATTLTMQMHSTNLTATSLLNVTATGAGGWCMSIKSLAKLAKALRYPIILNNQDAMLEDKYRMIPIQNSRGALLWHDGEISDASGRGIRSQYIFGCDGVDVVALTNTYLSSSMTTSVKNILN